MQIHRSIRILAGEGRNCNNVVDKPCEKSKFHKFPLMKAGLDNPECKVCKCKYHQIREEVPVCEDMGMQHGVCVAQHKSNYQLFPLILRGLATLGVNRIFLRRAAIRRIAKLIQLFPLVLERARHLGCVLHTLSSRSH